MINCLCSRTGGGGVHTNMLIERSVINRKFSSLAWKVFQALENNGNDCWDTNGEQRFIHDLFSYFQRSRGDDPVVMFDIGGNVGDYTQMLLKRSRDGGISSQIHVFEPTAACFSKLTTKFGSEPSVVLNRVAASDREGTVDIHYDKQESGFASLHQRNLKPFGFEMNKSESIQTIRLDQYVDDRGIGHIGFVKMDIEGHELTALRGLGDYLRADFIDFIQFEYGGANLDSHTSLLDLYSIFEGAGFTVAKVMRKGLALMRYRPAMDNFTFANYVAVSQSVLPLI